MCTLYGIPDFLARRLIQSSWSIISLLQLLVQLRTAGLLWGSTSHSVRET